MTDRLIAIEQKLDGLDQKIESLACFGRVGIPSLNKVETLLDELADILKASVGQKILYDDKQEWLDVEQAAFCLGYTQAHVRTLLRKGELKGKRTDSARSDGKEPWTISKAEIDAFMVYRRRPKD